VESNTALKMLKQSINSLANTPDELIENLFGICTLKKLNRREIFVRSGDYPKYVGFNLSGIFRLYYTDSKGNDWTKGFSTKGRFIISYSAMVQKRESFFNIESLTDSEILQFDYEEWMKMIRSDMRWYPLTFNLLQTVYIMKEIREKSFLLDDAASRYIQFMKEYPEVETNAKLYHIASFLGITPESLSRIRRKLKKLS